MSSTHNVVSSHTVCGLTTANIPPNWYAIQTRSRHERFVSLQLQSRGIDNYLPIITEMHRWSDRTKKVEVPLFSGYVFVHIFPNNEERVRVLRVHGVVRLVGHSAEGSSIPDEEIESIRTLIDQKIPWVRHPFLKVGQRIRIRGGALDGLEGIFQCRNGEDMLIISVGAIQRSLSISIRGYSIDAI